MLPIDYLYLIFFKHPWIVNPMSRPWALDLCLEILCEDSMWYLYAKFVTVSAKSFKSFSLLQFHYQRNIILLLNTKPNKTSEQQSSRAPSVECLHRYRLWEESLIRGTVYICFGGSGKAGRQKELEEQPRLHWLIPVLFQSLDINETWACLCLAGWVLGPNGCLYTINTMKKQPWKHLFSCC